MKRKRNKKTPKYTPPEHAWDEIYDRKNEDANYEKTEKR